MIIMIIMTAMTAMTVMTRIISSPWSLPWPVLEALYLWHVPAHLPAAAAAADAGGAVRPPLPAVFVSIIFIKPPSRLPLTLVACAACCS